MPLQTGGKQPWGWADSTAVARFLEYRREPLRTRVASFRSALWYVVCQATASRCPRQSSPLCSSVASPHPLGAGSDVGRSPSRQAFRAPSFQNVEGPGSIARRAGYRSLKSTAQTAFGVGHQRAARRRRAGAGFDPPGFKAELAVPHRHSGARDSGIAHPAGRPNTSRDPGGFSLPPGRGREGAAMTGRASCRAHRCQDDSTSLPTCTARQTRAGPGDRVRSRGCVTASADDSKRGCQGFFADDITSAALANDKSTHTSRGAVVFAFQFLRVALYIREFHSPPCARLSHLLGNSRGTDARAAATTHWLRAPGLRLLFRSRHDLRFRWASDRACGTSWLG